MMQQMRDLIAAMVPTSRDRYVRGTNSRATLRPESMSLWLEYVRSVKYTAKGGWYIDADVQEKARRRVTRYLRNHPGAKPPTHIADKGMRA